MSGNLTCTGRTRASIITAAVAALSDFKNSHTPSCGGVTNGTDAPTSTATGGTCTASGKGYTTIKAHSDATITDMIVITTQYDTAATDVMTNEVEVEQLSLIARNEKNKN